MRHSKIKFIIFLSLTIFCFGQHLDVNKSTKFKHYKTQINTTMKDYASNSEELLKNAQTDEEKSFANYIVGGSRYRDGLYLQSVNYFEKAEEYGRKSNSTDIQLGYINGLVMAYRRAGLLEQSNDAWERYIKLSKKSSNPYKEAEYYYNISKIYDIDAEYCKASEARKKYLSLVPPDIQKQDSDYIFAVYAQNAFVQMKCGKQHEAEQSVKKADETIVNIPEKTNSSLYEIYELASAMIALKNGETTKAQDLFDNAYAKSKEKNTISATKLILEERLATKIDSPEKQISFLKEVDEITKKEKLSTQQLAKYETIKGKEKIEKEKTKTSIWIIVSLFCLFGLIFVMIYSRHKNKKLRANFEKIIENLDKKNNSSKVISPINSDETKKIQNEKEIVKQLEDLEQKQFFIDKELSAVQLAVSLKITPRNLSYILKKYRNEDFYNYMNNIRIDHFRQILRDTPKYRNYKISVLADMIGYNSHTQLTINFKKKTGMNPSQYIAFLQKEENQK